MKISVCMIVKDEECVLERCLNCVQKFADEIIIVDTGSSDTTKNIAKRFTNKIFEFDWVDDFSKARNYSLSLATCDYIMWLDADDVVDDNNVAKILELKQRQILHDFYMFKYAVGFNKEGGQTYSFYRERLFSRNAMPRFQGFIHEVVQPCGSVSYEDITVEHRKVAGGDIKRNLKIYQHHKRNGVIFNTREQYYYSKELYYNGFYKSAEKSLKEYLKMPNKFYPNVVDAHQVLAVIYSEQEKKLKSNAILFNFLQKNVPNSEICCQIADNFHKMKKINNAICFYKFALTIKKDYKSGAFVNEDYYYLIPLLQLTVLCDSIGQRNEAKKYHEMAKRLAPNNASVLHNDKYFN